MTDERFQVTNVYRAGRHFLQIPGPTNVPDRILRAIDRPTIDHRGPEFGRLAREILDGLKQVFQTKQPVVVYPSSGTGAWEAALVNTLSPGDRVVMFETGHFASLWREMAERLGLKVDFVPGDWRRGVDPALVEAKLAEDGAQEIKAVAVVHNETSTGVASRIGALRQAIDRASHPALLYVDTISSLGSIDYRHDEWGVDVTVGCSQKGLMLPPGLGFNAISEKALRASESARFTKSYWGWDAMLKANQTGYFPYTPADQSALWPARGARHVARGGPGGGLRAPRPPRPGDPPGGRCLGPGAACLEPEEYSGALTAVRLPEGHDADAFRKVVLEAFDMSLGNGLSKLQGKVFRIGHLGDFNDLMMAATLSGVEMGLRLAGVPHRAGGVQAALDELASGR